MQLFTLDRNRRGVRPRVVAGAFAAENRGQLGLRCLQLLFEFGSPPELGRAEFKYVHAPITIPVRRLAQLIRRQRIFWGWDCICPMPHAKIISMILKRLLRAVSKLPPTTHRRCIMLYAFPLGWQRQFTEGPPCLSQLPLKQAMRVRSAECWLKLGKPHEALAELEKLSADARKHPLAIKVHLLAGRAASQMYEVTLQA